MRSILNAIGRSITHWWEADRIRVSASEGRLLRLRVGQRVLIFGQIWSVEESNVEDSNVAEGTNTRTSCLRVRLTNTDSTDNSQAAMLEVPVMNTFIGRNYTLNLDDNFKLFKKVWPSIVKLAEDNGVKIGIENCPMLFS